ncbi:hypothetical protein BpHYR1_042131 [Brachionus plicatilis]|uniref:Uncharacterized protein n=1 Tax=Brachionus plicatilis TaxID=10195 RepID=A0A3M7R306_BRAPC|nr:hypothetical protein BpHYR1_042131 [Brachionus plicatilis]
MDAFMDFVSFKSISNTCQFLIPVSYTTSTYFINLKSTGFITLITLLKEIELFEQKLNRLFS